MQDPQKMDVILRLLRGFWVFEGFGLVGLRGRAVGRELLSGSGQDGHCSRG